MFISLLNTPQQLLLVRSAVAIAAIDGSFDGREDALIDHLLAQTHLTVDPEDARVLVIPETLPGAVAEAFSEEPHDAPSRRAFVSEVAQMITADGDAGEEELELLRGFIAALGLPSEQTDDFVTVGNNIREAESAMRRLVHGRSSRGL